MLILRLNYCENCKKQGFPDVKGWGWLLVPNRKIKQIEVLACGTIVGGDLLWLWVSCVA